MHAALLIDVTGAHDRRSVQKRLNFCKLYQCIADDVRDWLVSLGRLRQIGDSAPKPLVFLLELSQLFQLIRVLMPPYCLRQR